MTYQEILDRAREIMAPNCKVCPVCDGRACRGQIPGVGGIGSGRSFTVCREYLDSVRVLMDVIYEPGEIDTSLELFGRRFAFPFFPAPIGGMNGNYNGALTEAEYSRAAVEGMAECGGFAFTPDSPGDDVFRAALPYIQAAGGLGVPTVKPWGREKLLGRIREAREAGAMAVACDVDSCGNLNLKRAGMPVYPMSPETLATIVKAAGAPFVPKGIMTAAAAARCAEAGCYGVVVSSHGGRVLEDSPAPCAMLPEIRAAVGHRLKLFVDGGVRTGLDVFKCLALGADAVLIGRPYAAAIHGGGKEGVAVYTRKVLDELRDVMLMTGCRTLSDITPDKIRLG